MQFYTKEQNKLKKTTKKENFTLGVICSILLILGFLPMFLINLCGKLAENKKRALRNK